MKQRCCVLLAILFTLAFTPAMAGDGPPGLMEKDAKDDAISMETLMDYYLAHRDDIKQIPPEVSKGASEGNARAEFWLAFLTGNGIGVQKNHREALKWYHIAADQNYVPAEWKVGVYYENGWGGTQSFDEAIKWYLKAANAGNAAAQTQLGDTYLYGRGVTAQTVDALHWYKMAADQGYAPAQLDLAMIYCGCRGSLDEPDYTEAVSWLRKAADQNSAAAMIQLGQAYSKGHGVPQDYKEAAAWYRKAWDAGNPFGYTALADLYMAGSGVPQSYEQAAAYYKQAAEKGDSSAMEMLTELYSRGVGIQRNSDEAAKWAARLEKMGPGNASSVYNFGNMYFRGEGVPKDVNKAMELWTFSAEMGNRYAQNNLGATYFDGIEVKQDYFLAYMWLNAAVANGFDHSREKRDKAMSHLSEAQIAKARGLSRGYVSWAPGDIANWNASDLEKDAMAEFRFGNQYHDGNGTKQNYAEAAKWYRKAAEQNVIPAEIALGIAYERGEGVTQDYAEAAKWYRKAALQGDGDAQKFIGLLYERGAGVSKDPVQAYAWYELAMQMYGHDAVFEQTRLAKSMTQEQVEAAKKMAKEWKDTNKVHTRRFDDSPIADPVSDANH